MAGKSCIFDPVPGVLLKDCYGVLLPVIRCTVNLSLDNATVPMKLKEAALTPIIKKESFIMNSIQGPFLISDMYPRQRKEWLLLV